MRQILIALEILEPASPAVPTASPEKQHYDDDDKKGCGVHIVLLGVIRDRDRHTHLLLCSLNWHSRKKLS